MVPKRRSGVPRAFALLVLIVLAVWAAPTWGEDCQWKSAPRTTQATATANAIGTTCDPSATLAWAGLACATFADPGCQVEYFAYCFSDENVTCEENTVTTYPVNQLAAISGTGTASISGLSFYTTYNFYVRAGNCMGISDWIATAPLIIYPYSLPDETGSQLVITPGDECQVPRAINLIWTPFQNMNPLSSTDYYEYCIASDTESTCLNTTLPSATVYADHDDTYNITIIGFNCAGESGPLVKSVVITSPVVPDATGGMVTLTKTSVPPNCLPQLNAVALFPNFFPIGSNHYEYCFSVNSQCDLVNVTETTIPAATLSNLQNGTTYYASFRLANCIGESSWVTSQGIHISGLFPDGSECCEPAPLPPTVRLSEMDPCIHPRQARVEFSGLVGFRYSFEYCVVESPERPSNCSGAETFTTRDGNVVFSITDSDTYWVVARASNCAGNSSWAISNSIYAGAENAPTTTNSTSVVVEVGNFEPRHCLEPMHASWAGFVFADNRTYVGPYEVCLSSTEETKCDLLDWTVVLETQFEWSVCGNTTYNFHVRASNCEGQSEVVTSEPFKYNITSCPTPPKFNVSTLNITAHMDEFVCNSTKVLVTVNITTSLNPDFNNTGNTTGFEYCVVSSDTSEECLVTRDWTALQADESWTFIVTFMLDDISKEDVLLRVRPFNCVGAAAWDPAHIEINLPHECHNDIVSLATPTTIIGSAFSVVAVTAATIGTILL